MAVNMSLASILGSKEVAQFDFDLSGVRDVYDEIREAQNEVGGTVTFRAKVATGGGKAFDIITGDEDSDTSVQAFSGIIIHNHKCNAYFDEDSVGNSPPVCSSTDGVSGVNRESGEVCECKDCPYNEYGTAKNGKGKACKNMHRLYILTEGSPIPIVLSLPPTSLKAFQNYRLSTLASKKLKPREVVTEFSLSAETSSLGQKYSVVKFKLLGRLSPEMTALAAYFAQGFAPAVEITADDYSRADKADAAAEKEGT